MRELRPSLCSIVGIVSLGRVIQNLSELISRKIVFSHGQSKGASVQTARSCHGVHVDG